MQQSMFSSAELPASPSPSPASARAWQIRVATSPSRILPSLTAIGPSGWSGRTSPACCPRTTDGRLAPSSEGWGELGYGFAYRVLDAQYFGLAQRRARVFVVGHLGDWRRAAAVLFERESLSGHPAPRREAGQRVADSLTVGANQCSGTRSDFVEAVAPTIPSRNTGGGGLGTDFDCDGGLIASDLCPTLRAGGNRTGGDRPPGTDVDTCDSLIASTAPTLGQRMRGPIDAMFDGALIPVPVAEPYTLAVRGRGDSHDLEYRQDGVANAVLTPNGGRGGIGVGAIAFSVKDHGADAGEIAPTLRAGGHDESHANGGVMPAVAFGWQNSESQGASVSEHVTPTLDKSKTPAILQSETLSIQGFTAILMAYADATEADSEKVLYLLREVADSTAGARRRLGELAPFWTPEILRSGVLCEGAGREAERVNWMDDDALPREEVGSAGEVRNLQGSEGRRCPSPRRGSHEQRPGQPSACVPRLPHAASSGAECVFNLWATGEGSRLLQQALHTLEEVRRSADAQGPARFQVRRLSPRECERLQGFPDDYTLIPYRGKPAADGPRYKALGNSMAVPCMRWIGRRIQMLEDALREEVA
jgi:site-specific DNA-cytosine methylase